MALSSMLRKLSILLTCLAATLAAASAHAVKVADITRLSGHRTNMMVGLGLVVGLKGTGDGGEFSAAINPLRAMLAQFADPVEVRQLANAQNVAVVNVMATIPANGVHSGDKLDVYVSSLGAATSLKGGRLFLTPLQVPVPIPKEERDKILPLAFASGPIAIEDASTPTVGVVRGGAVMDWDLPMPVISNGRVTLILEEPAASWTTASTIAKIINDAEGSGETLAIVRDRTTVEVTIPLNERDRPDSFISRIQQLPVRMLPTEARVQINEKKGTIVITGDVEISPVVISHNGLTITTTNPPPTPTPRTPVTTEKRTVGLDTTNQGGAKLQDLVDALDMIKVPTQDRITIIQELYKTGKLHAKLITE
jgi:flagellar P-ring protein precursor FlgI